MQSKTKWYGITLLSWIPAAFLGSYVLFFLLPAMFWYLAGRKLEPTRALLLFLVTEKGFAKLRNRIGKRAFLQNGTNNRNEYFLANEGFPSIPSKTFTILISTMGLALWLPDLFGNSLTEACKATMVPGASPPWLIPILFSLPIIFLLPFVLFPIWIYEDSGLRNYDAHTRTISLPGRAVRDILTDAGILLSIIALVVNCPTQLGLLAGGVVLFLLPPALLGAVIFSYHVEPNLLAKFRKTSTVDGIPKGRISIQMSDSG